jgi:hypothetical protein
MTSKSIYYPTWLYIKQHPKTGLKYFGKTTRKDPSSYEGSGTHWQRHLNIHGREHNTIWTELFTDEESLIEFALFFSEFHDIVNSKEWANLMPENGLIGACPGRIISQEERKKMSDNHWARKRTKETNPNTGSKRSPETCRNISLAKIGKKHKTSKPKSKEVREKWSQTRRNSHISIGKRLPKLTEAATNILTLFLTKPELDYGQIMGNGKRMTYERAFALKYANQFDMTVTGLYNIISLKTVLSKQIMNTLCSEKI